MSHAPETAAPAAAHETSAASASGAPGARAVAGSGMELVGRGEVVVRRALLSVHDKSSIVELARALHELGVQIISTGGTARALSEAGLEPREIERCTGFPEIMEGRVKTLHPRIHGALLARRDDPQDVSTAQEHGIEPIDLVCVNLYPFERAVAGGASMREALENIDIGGPTMIRAAAKNHPFVAVVVDPADYEELLAELRACGGRVSLQTRERLAARAFAYTARYEAAIARWFAVRAYEGFPPRWASAYEKVMDLRYGENPHQQAAFYAEAGAPTHLLAGVRQLHGKELSFNNLLDLDAARGLVEELDGRAGAAARDGAATRDGDAMPDGARDAPAAGAPAAAVAIIKHTNPCGAAVAGSASQAYARALACDPQSAFGGIVALNRRVERSLAEALGEQFVEVLLAPGYDADALEVLTRKKNVRLLELADWPAPGGEPVERPVLGGVLSQRRDAVTEDRAQMRVVTSVAPSAEQWADLMFAWRVCLHVRSNAIVLARGGATVGIGAGQMSRVDSVRIAVEKARAAQPELLPGCCLASDAFFPFADNIELAAQAGVAAIIQPGGSVRDEEVIASAQAAGIAMVLTGVRHFRH
jgi:phosphoribosylaminoimidazolecarboxamide formyltransferase/IMP cyclohydrolase